MEKGPRKCEYEKGCRNPAAGRFRYKYFNDGVGDSVEKEQSLCGFHKNRAKEEIEKVEGEFDEI